MAFAELYLVAFDAHLGGGTPSRPWRLALDAPADLPALRHVLLGINAHVNYDLPQALLTVITDADFTDPFLMDRRRRDHERIDGVLAGRVASKRFLREARLKVWHNTTELQAARLAGPTTYGGGSITLMGGLAGLVRPELASDDSESPPARGCSTTTVTQRLTDTPWRRSAEVRQGGGMSERNVLGGPLEPCGSDPMTGFYRDGSCTCGDDDLGLHAICAVVTEEFLAHQRAVGNDLSTPMPQYSFPGLHPGDRWCVVAARWLQAYQDGVAAPVVLASTNERALEVVPLEVLREHSVDVPPDLSTLR